MSFKFEATFLDVQSLVVESRFQYSLSNHRSRDCTHKHVILDELAVRNYGGKLEGTVGPQFGPEVPTSPYPLTKPS